jgi:hypothetical protein
MMDLMRGNSMERAESKHVKDASNEFKLMQGSRLLRFMYHAYDEPQYIEQDYEYQ